MSNIFQYRISLFLVVLTYATSSFADDLKYQMFGDDDYASCTGGFYPAEKPDTNSASQYIVNKNSFTSYEITLNRRFINWMNNKANPPGEIKQLLEKYKDIVSVLNLKLFYSKSSAMQDASVTFLPKGGLECLLRFDLLDFHSFALAKLSVSKEEEIDYSLCQEMIDDAILICSYVQEMGFLK